QRRRQPAAHQRVRGDGGGQPPQLAQRGDRDQRRLPGGGYVRGGELRRRNDLVDLADREQRQPGGGLLRSDALLRWLRQPIHVLPVQRGQRGAGGIEHRRRSALQPDRQHRQARIL